jgi:hypothetical protein
MPAARFRRHGKRLIYQDFFTRKAKADEATCQNSPMKPGQSGTGGNRV